MNRNQTVAIDGSCHCGNIRFTLYWPASSTDIPVRECGCTFCRKHGGAWTSHRESTLRAIFKDQSLISAYHFGTETAAFHVCARCGVVPFVTSDIDDHLYAVVNCNTLNATGQFTLSRSASNFSGEELVDRLARRKRNWISNVEISLNPA